METPPPVNETIVSEMGEERFIESEKFPFWEISEAAAVEKGPGRPPHWEMVFWPARKPLISARAIIAGCLLPKDTNPKAFLRNIGIGGKKKAAHSNPPFYRFPGVKLLDPFAGFGSIPLEAMRLGLEATAVELLPTAYVFLKAVLEYPAKYGRKLVEDVEKWGQWVIEQLKNDPLIKELYDEDVAVYIGTWEIKCPHCGRWTPLVGNWWLARVKGDKGYKRLAWMEPTVENGEVGIRVVDLNKILGDRAVSSAQVSRTRVVAGGREFRVPEANIEARRERATCLLCHQPISWIDPQTGKHYIDAKNLPKEVRERLEGYVKYAIKTYNQSLEREDVTPLARQRLLVKVKVKDGDLEFEPCTEKDQEKLELAKREVEKMVREGDPDIPREPVPTYEAGLISPVYNVDKWYKLFNPRQLLTHAKLVKLIREAGKRIEEEKLKEGLTPEQARQYAEAVTQYLALMHAKYIDHNTICTHWNPNFPTIGQTLSPRGLSISWSWTDGNPLARFTGSLVRNKETVLRSLNYLVENVQNGGSCRVILDDATSLMKIDPREKFDLIVTDPPYYDDAPYTELSDFYYVWLKRALSDVKDGRLAPRFLPEAFFERFGDNWIETLTQWEKYALSEISFNPARLGPHATREEGRRHFQNLLEAAFFNMASRLTDNGVLVTYYMHTDPEALKALLKAGWERAGLSIVNVFPITTEPTQRSTQQGRLAIDASMVITWRKGASGSIDAAKLYEEMIEKATDRVARLIELGVSGRDLFFGALAAALATATKYREIYSLGKLSIDDLVDKYICPAATLGLASALAKGEKIRESIRSPDAMFYILVKTLMPGERGKALRPTDLGLLSLGTSLNLRAAIKDYRLLKETKSRERGGERRNFILLEPQSTEKAKIAELLEARGLEITGEPTIRCTIDALHLIEYYAVAYPEGEFKQKLERLREKYPAQVDEALSLARIFAKVLPENDPEKKLCERIIEALGEKNYTTRVPNIERKDVNKQPKSESSGIPLEISNKTTRKKSTTKTKIIV
ncbi:MAG: DUF1156 domain-containing protein [Thermofilaceae archaeon]